MYISLVLEMYWRRKLFAVVIGQRFHPGGCRCEFAHNSLVTSSDVLWATLDSTAYPLLFTTMVTTAPWCLDGVALTMTDLPSVLSMRRPVTQGSTARYLPSAIAPTGLALSLFLLTSKVLTKCAAMSFISADKLIKLMTNV